MYAEIEDLQKSEKKITLNMLCPDQLSPNAKHNKVNKLDNIHRSASHKRLVYILAVVKNKFFIHCFCYEY